VSVRNKEKKTTYNQLRERVQKNPSDRLQFLPLVIRGSRKACFAKQWRTKKRGATASQKKREGKKKKKSLAMRMRRVS